MIKKFIKDGTQINNKIPEDCPQPEDKSCELVYEEGCLNCKTCGKAKCG
jgi:ribonucleoside-diphosphate reductase alpha chain